MTKRRDGAAVTTYLLDVNVLIALVDPAHVQHEVALPGHQFWADTISMLDPAHFDMSRLSSHGQVTDSYLLALAQSKGGRLASMDPRLVTDAVPGGQDVLALI